jgi:radical SAM superfamily enzyme YgiQ (UPF0313 family)
MTYKKGPAYRVRPVPEIEEDLDQAREIYGHHVRTLFFPAGNTIAMPTPELAHICSYARSLFPDISRITVYGSSKYIFRKGLADLKRLKRSGLSRIHVGLESGDDEVLRRIKKGSDSVEQTRAGKWVREAGIELSEYVVLGIGGRERTREHALATARVLNAINPDFIRLRTFLPKIDTVLLHQIKKGRFEVLSAREVLEETRLLIENLNVTSQIHSDHYTNYVNARGRMPDDRERILKTLEEALKKNEGAFRPVYVGTQ